MRTIPHPHYTIEIHPDHDCESPISLGDSEGIHLAIGNLNNRYFSPKGAISIEQGKELDRRKWQAFPVYMYAHSGIALSTSPYSDPWDSGRLGTLLLKKSNFPPKTRQKSAFLILQEWADYANGETYGFIILKDGEEIDSCWGFIGYDNTVDAAIEAADSLK